MSSRKAKKQRDWVLRRVRAALSCGGAANYLPCREEESATITRFVRSKLAAREPGSLYLCGQPGTGKSALVAQILRAAKRRPRTPRHVVDTLNCVGMDPESVFHKMWEAVCSPKAAKRGWRDADDLERELFLPGDMMYVECAGSR